MDRKHGHFLALPSVPGAQCERNRQSHRIRDSALFGYAVTLYGSFRKRLPRERHTSHRARSSAGVPHPWRAVMADAHAPSTGHCPPARAGAAPVRRRAHGNPAAAPLLARRRKTGGKADIHLVTATLGDGARAVCWSPQLLVTTQTPRTTQTTRTTTRPWYSRPVRCHRRRCRQRRWPSQPSWI